jgi:AraC-like DNA-binding protein
MNAPASLLEQLHARLRERVLAGTPVGDGQCFYAARAHALRALSLDNAFIALPLQGHKRLREVGQAQDVFIHPGELLLVPGPCCADVENLPDAHGAPYLALGLSFAPAVLATARALHAPPARPACPNGELSRPATPPPACAVPLNHALIQTLLHWCDAQDQGQTALARHALVGLVLQLCALGHTGLLAQPVPTLAARIRAMVAAEPGREWTSAEVELATGLSGATLRRHLAAENTRLRQVLADARLSHALGLLASTRLPLKTVAARVGYQSVASFSRRFSERFGVEPARLGA